MIDRKVSFLRNSDNSSPVFSSHGGRLCPKCGNPVKQCTCKAQTSGSAADARVRVSKETKGRKGKGVTLVTGLPMHPDGLKDLARELKQKCGSGGTVKKGIIEIQGDHRDVIVKELQDKGYAAKKSGG